MTKNIAVRIIAARGAIGSGRVRDVSASGAFIETRLQLPPLTWLEIEADYTVSGRRGRSRIAASVVRSASHGIGVEWCDSWGQTVDEICRLIAGGPSDLAPPRLPEEPPLPVPAQRPLAAPSRAAPPPG